MQQLRGDQEVLTATTVASVGVDVAIDASRSKFVAFGIAGAAGDIHHAFMDKALIAGVHALVDFVDDAEGRTGERLEGHEIEYCGDGAFATGLAVGVEDGEGFVFPMPLLAYFL